MSDLQHWMQQAKDHWRQFRPQLYKQALKAGMLNQLLEDAAELTEREMKSLEAAGMAAQDAWEMVREEYLFLPEPKREAPSSEAERDSGPMTGMSKSTMRAFLTGE